MLTLGFDIGGTFTDLALLDHADGSVRAVPLRAAIDTFDELDYFRNGGILHYVLRGLARDKV